MHIVFNLYSHLTVNNLNDFSFKVTYRPLLRALGLGAYIPILEFEYEVFRIAHIRCLAIQTFYVMHIGKGKIL